VLLCDVDLKNYYKKISTHFKGYIVKQENFDEFVACRWMVDLSDFNTRLGGAYVPALRIF
jgi:hypothetical protein